MATKIQTITNVADQNQISAEDKKRHMVGGTEHWRDRGR